MIDQDKKLQLFKQAVFDDAAERARVLIDDTRAECEERIAKAKSEAELSLENSKAQTDSELKSISLRKSSSSKLESRRQVLLCREAIVDRVFESVNARLEEFRGSKAYLQLLISRVRECQKAYPDRKGKLQISVKDRAIKGELEKATGLKAELSDRIIAGGVTVLYPEDNLALDCTFDSGLKAQRSGFAKRAGLVIE